MTEKRTHFSAESCDLRNRIATITIDDQGHRNSEIQQVLVAGYVALKWALPLQAAAETIEAIAALVNSASAPCSSQNTAESSPPVMSGVAGADTARMLDAAQAVPVAWRWRTSPAHYWAFTEIYPGDDVTDVQPLYASQPSPDLREECANLDYMKRSLEERVAELEEQIERPKCMICGLEDGACICAHLRPRSSADNAKETLRYYANQCCEGWCKDAPDNADFGEDCLGCRARLALRTPIEPQTARKTEPRFYIDHGMIHDRVTGKHVTTDGEPPFEDGIEETCDLLNGLAATQHGDKDAIIERLGMMVSQLHERIEQLRSQPQPMSTREAALEAAARGFIEKVDRGHARSLKSYSAFLAALALPRPQHSGE